MKDVHLALDGLVVKVRVAGGHPNRAVIEHPLDHRQRHAVVDQAGAEVMTEPVRMQPARQPPAAVTDLRDQHVALEHVTDPPDRHVMLAAGGTSATGRRGRQQEAGAVHSERGGDELLVALQLLEQHRADRDHRLAPQPDVEIAQARVPVGADLKRVPRECHDARDPQPGEREQHDDRAVLL